MTLTQSPILILSLILLIITQNINSQPYTIHGYLRDRSNGEALIGANVYIKGTTKGVFSNAYGFYSFTLPAGKYTFIYSYIGYDDIEKDITLTGDIVMNIELQPHPKTIEEVVITAKGKNENITSSKMSTQKLDGTTIEKVPVLFGEADVIKTLKLLPGVVGTSEVGSNISVRGGARDQNMLLLDEATVYNASHLLGLFSVFNNDAIKSVELYKGIMPAQYGGRISSLIDIRMKEGNMKEFAGAGSVGLLTSRLTLETPIIKDKASLLVSGRRTYIDLLMKGLNALAPGQIPDIPVHFYDFNAKSNLIINDNNRLYLSGYFGRDVYKFEVGKNGRMSNSWGNYTGTMRWNHVFSKRLFSNFTFLASNYDYNIEVKNTYSKEEKTIAFDWLAYLNDYSMKADFGYFLNPENTFRFGVVSTYHKFNVGEVSVQNDTFRYSFQIPKYNCIEWAGYISNEQKIGNLTLDYGLRGTILQNIGEGKVYELEDYSIVDTLHYGKGETYNVYWGLEPRISLSYTIDERHSVKLGYAHTMQYVHVASNSEAGNPLEVWMPVGPNVKPQFADQVSIGYFRNFLDNVVRTSIETYYKYMQNQIEFKEFSEPYLNEFIDEEFRFGVGRAYGLELMIEKPEGRLSGWISYTLSRSERKIKDIQEKGWYLSPFDITHNTAIVGMYDATRRLSISANWIYLTGRPFSAPVARWEYGDMILPFYGGRNKSRYPSTHRLDLSVVLKNKPKKRYTSSWTFAVYNFYNQRNPNVIYFDNEEDTHYNTQAYKISLLPRIISVSYNFNF